MITAQDAAIAARNERERCLKIIQNCIKRHKDDVAKVHLLKNLLARVKGK